MKKKEEENTDIKEKERDNPNKKEVAVEVKKISFLPKDQDYLIKLIGLETYNQLLEASSQWDILVTQKSVDFASLTNRHKVLSDMLNDKDFKTIIEIHEKIKTLQEKEDQGVIPFLIDLIQHQQFNFLIPHLFLTREVLNGYNNVHFSFLGLFADIAKVLEFSTNKLEIQKTNIFGGHHGN